MRIVATAIAAILLVSCQQGNRNSPEGGSGNDTAQGNASRSGEEKGTTVEVLRLEPERFVRHMESTGHLEAVQDAFISPETNGQVQEIPVKRGERVERGDLLVKLNTDVIRKNIEEVRVSLELAERVFQKQQDLWEQNIGSELQFLEARNRKESLEARLATLEMQVEKARISAPFPGIVDDILIKEGELAAPGARLLRLVNLKEMRALAEVSESFLGSVMEGDTVEIRFPAYPGKQVREPVARVGKVIDPQTRTFTLEVLLENRDEALKPNMLTILRIEEESREHALVVPSIAMREDFEGTFLFRIGEEDGRRIAEKIYVKPGLTVQERTAVEAGVSPGDSIIIKGYHLVGDGTPVEILAKGNE